MAKRYGILLIMISVAMFLGGCANRRQDTSGNLQRLTKIEVYAQDNVLLNTIEDKEILLQYQEWIVNLEEDEKGQEDEWKEELEGCNSVYSIVTYKTPAAVFNDGTLEESTVITVYQDTNLIKYQILPENIKSFSVSAEDLAFYYIVPDENLEFLHTLTGNLENEEEP